MLTYMAMRLGRGHPNPNPGCAPASPDASSISSLARIEAWVLGWG